MSDGPAAQSGIGSRFAKLKNPLTASSKPRRDEDDAGEDIDYTTIAGGGHPQLDATKATLHVSRALRSFLVREKVLAEADAGLDAGATTSTSTPALRELLQMPHVLVPPEITDRSHPLTDYFISSSHNTYLLAHQLYGSSSAQAYATALKAGARCVEIDAWDNDDDKDEPKVTHGYTLVSNVPFRAVCETIRDVVDEEARSAAGGVAPAPILLSLENHCGTHGQVRLVKIMQEVLADRLLSAPVRQKGHEEQTGEGDHVRLEDLGSKIVIIVEYHLPHNEDGPEGGSRSSSSSSSCSSSSSSSSNNNSSGEDDENRAMRQTYKQKKKAAAAGGIVPELAALGIYAQSVKPRDRSWLDPDGLKDRPHHHLINVSETHLMSHMPAANGPISRHNCHHLMRVFPKGTRVSSQNLNPVPFWGVGAQICAMNWQTFAGSLQLNSALFAGTDGFVLKPPALRAGGSRQPTMTAMTTTMERGLEGGKRKKRLLLHVAGAADIPVPRDREPGGLRPYLTCTLVHPSDLAKEPPKRKTAAYRHHHLGILHSGENPPSTDPIWDETLEWVYDDDDLTFLRILIKSDDSFALNPVIAVVAVRVSCLVTGGWRFIEMLDLGGRRTGCSVLLRFDLEDVS